MTPREPRFPTARRSMRSVEAAAIAGIVFAIVFVAALVLMLRAPAIDASAAEIESFYSHSGDVQSVLLGLNLVPIAVIALLWFIAVIRKRIGSREDKLFSTVFLGGGLLFSALVLAGAATVGAPALVADLTGRPPDLEASTMIRGVGIALLSIHAPRLGSLFILSASTLGLRTGAFPRWLSLFGYVLGVGMLLPLPLIESARYAFPMWVGIASIALLIRQAAVPGEIGLADRGSAGSDSNG